MMRDALDKEMQLTKQLEKLSFEKLLMSETNGSLLEAELTLQKYQRLRKFVSKS